MPTPVDQLGLLILARMYHRHFAVFLKEGAWSTRCNNSVEHCTIYFVYNEGCLFSDTVEGVDNDNVDKSPEEQENDIEVLHQSPINLMNPGVQISPPPIVREESSLSSSDSDGHQSALSDGEEQSGLSTLHVNAQQSGLSLPDGPQSELSDGHQSGLSTSHLNPQQSGLSSSDSDSDGEPSGLCVPKSNDQQSGLSSSNSDSHGHETSLDKEEPPEKRSKLQVPLPKPKPKPKSNRKPRPQKKTKRQIALERKIARELKKKEEKKRMDYEANLKLKFNLQECDIVIKNMDDKDMSPRRAKPSVSALIEQDPVINNMDDKDMSPRRTKPSVSALIEQDPILAAFKDVRPKEVDSLLADDRKKSPARSSKISEESHPTGQGSLNIKKYGAFRGQKKDKKLKCSVAQCDSVFPLIKELNKHMKEVHPDSKFKCKYCPRSYDSHNLKYKHEATHFEFRYQCHFCEKKFQFLKQRDKHEGQHTGRGLFPCTWPSCKAKLSCKDALNQHIVTHMDERFACEKCDKYFNTMSNLKAHMKGKHGDGFISLCGAAHDWDDGRSTHQKECDECKEIRYTMEHKNPFPEPRKQWCRSIKKDKALPFMFKPEIVYSLPIVCADLKWFGVLKGCCFPLSI